MPQLNDIQIIEAIGSGQIHLYRQLVETYKERVFVLAYRICKNESDAEEVAQDSFLKAYNALNTFKKESKFSTWLYRIVYNTSLSKLRKKRIETSPIEDITNGMDKDHSDDALESLISEERKEEIWHAVEQLGAEDSAIIEMFYVEERPLNEIADIVGTSHGNIRVKISRIRKRLEALLKNEKSYLV